LCDFDGEFTIDSQRKTLEMRNLELIEIQKAAEDAERIQIEKDCEELQHYLAEK
jgi:hypothetical protein